MAEDRNEPRNNQEEEAKPSRDVREEIISRARRPERKGPAGGADHYAVPGREAGDAAAERLGDRAERLAEQTDEYKRSVLYTQIVLFGPNLRDMAVFCRQLSTLLDVGIPLLQSLKILAQRTTHPKLRKVVGKVAARVEEGNTLSSALREHPRVFSSLFVNVVEVGELGGILESSMRRLSDVLEMKASIRGQVRSALMYPCAALIVCIGVVGLIMGWAVPKFQKIYDDLGGDLPDITQNLIAMSDFVRNYPHLYIPVAIIGSIGLWLYGKTPSGKALYDWIALRCYIVGTLSTKINVARFTRSLGSLLAAGIPLLEGLRVTASTSENSLIARRLDAVHDTLESGGRLEDPLRRDFTIPPMVVDMMVIGYEAGALDDMLLRIADIYDEDVDQSLKGLSSIIEPVLIIFLGVVVAFVALALLLPYFNLVHEI